MTAPNSRGVHEARMHRVLEYIERHLDEPLDLTVLADVSCEICIAVTPL